MTFTHTPKYPVVHPKPEYGMIFRNIRFSDVVTVVAFSGIAFVSMWFGARKSLRRTLSRDAAFTGAFAGLMYGDLSISQRLMGLLPNEPEVKKYGFYTAEELEEYAKDDIANGVLIGRIPKEREWRNL